MLRGKVSAAQQRKARADHELEVARAAAEAAERSLDTEFGTTLAGAGQLLEQAEADLREAVADAEKALEEAGG